MSDGSKSPIERILDRVGKGTEDDPLPGQIGEDTPLGVGSLGTPQSVYLSTDLFEEIRIDHDGTEYRIETTEDGLEVVEVDDED